MIALCFVIFKPCGGSPQPHHKVAVFTTRFRPYGTNCWFLLSRRLLVARYRSSLPAWVHLLLKARPIYKARLCHCCHLLIVGIPSLPASRNMSALAIQTSR